MKTDQIFNYSHTVSAMLEKTIDSQHDAMLKVAEVWAQAIQNGKLLYSFGSGHSRFIAGELYWRAGGLAPVVQIEDPTNGKAERVEGYAQTFMEHYDIKPGDLLVVVSNSGINAVPLEAAMYGKSAGAVVIAVTSLDYSKNAKPRHSSGKKLYEVADYILDTQNVKGDAIVDLEGLEGWKVAPASTLISVGMLNAIVAQTAQNLADKGIKPPVLLSSNIAEGDLHNKQLSEKYWPVLTSFPRKGTF